MGNIEKKFKVTGMQYYEKDFFDALAYENDDFDLKPRELFDMYDENERVYQYCFNDVNAELKPEEDNPEDRNAVAVYVGGIKIGYIKRGACSQVKNLLSSLDLSGVRVVMGGGKYKTVCEDEDGKIKVDRDQCGYFADVIISLRSDEEAAPAAPAATVPSNMAAAEEKAKKKGGGVLIGFGIFALLIGGGSVLGGNVGGLVGVLIGAACLYFGIKKRNK